MTGNSPYFTPELFQFLKQLKRNNRRPWFLKNKGLYEAAVLHPAVRFVADFAERLYDISPHLLADARPYRGSLMRIYRDVRFSHDKKPYKTNVGMNFPHAAAGKRVHVPGFYVHLEPGECFAAAGLWHPDASTLLQVRNTMVRHPDAWKKARRGLELEGGSLKRAPKGYCIDHPLIEDLKRTDFIASLELSEKEVCSPRFMAAVVAACQKLSPLVEFTAKALGLPY